MEKNTITTDIIEKLNKKAFGTIDLKKYKHLYAFLPDILRKNTLDDDQYEKYVCSKILSIRKYADDNISITYIDLDKNYKEKSIDENDTRHLWERLTTTKENISEIEFSENFKDFLIGNR